MGGVVGSGCRTLVGGRPSDSKVGSRRDDELMAQEQKKRSKIGDRTSAAKWKIQLPVSVTTKPRLAHRLLIKA